MKMRPFVCFVIAASTACVGTAVQAGEPVQDKHEATGQTSVSPSQPGLRAYIDPLTGRLAPVPEQRVETDLQTSPLQRDDSKMWTEPVEGKGILLHTEGQIQMATMARFGTDGKLETTCGPAAHEAHSEPTPVQNKPEPQQ